MKQKFQIGDRVTVASKYFDRYNSLTGVGIVENIISGDSSSRVVYQVRFLDKRSLFGFYSYELEKYQEEIEFEIKNGDYVETAAGHRGVISSLSKNGAMIIENGRSWFVDLRYIKKKIEQLQNTTNIGNERTIKLTLEKAKEYYKQGGELRNLALKAFTEEELSPKPKVPHTWEEYKNDFYPFENHMHYIPKFAQGFNGKDCDAFIAYGRLIRLRRAWLRIRETNNPQRVYSIIYTVTAGIIVYTDNSDIVFPLSFPSKEMATEFINCFGDLLEQAKGLY